MDTGKAEPITANIYRIDDARTKSYIPSKAWWSSDDDDIHLLYYTSPTLPSAARPFGDKPCYAFTKAIKDNETIDYPIDAKILIDQLLINGSMHYLFLFADDQAKSILATQWDGSSWPVDIPEIVLYKGEQ
jgi:hypothetical protein